MTLALDIMAGVFCALIVALVTVRGVVTERAYDSLHYTRANPSGWWRKDLIANIALTLLCVALMACLAGRVYVEIA
ncbi:hypothetical protein BJ973_003165 [Actinoplanes tereljensis]|uniref:Uncharacterized protein n=1 Tax=Paractinoplanes tereljensis TaxID=571912 RepID=A0A919TWE9_9ACTN|nr:hypothetical protein [Actinoplanes tereljensis]GIF25893.1 hypothetical protein Ate02nite_86230 [Actinoplanes tereljensis]